MPTLKRENTPEPGFTTTIEYVMTPKGPRAVKVICESSTQNTGGAEIRKVKVMELMRQHIAETEKPEVSQNVDENRFVRSVYTTAAARGESAGQAVAKALGVSIATAGRRIRKSKSELGWC